MLEIVVGAKEYKSNIEGYGLVKTLTLPGKGGNIESIGAVVAPLGPYVHAITHFRMRRSDNSTFDDVQMAFPLSYNSASLLCRNVRAKYKDIDLFFNYDVESSLYKDSFHKTGQCCVEFGGSFTGKTYREFQRNFSEYRALAYSLFKNLYGSGASRSALKIRANLVRR